MQHTTIKKELSCISLFRSFSIVLRFMRWPWRTCKTWNLIWYAKHHIWFIYGAVAELLILHSLHILFSLPVLVWIGILTIHRHQDMDSFQWRKWRHLLSRGVYHKDFKSSWYVWWKLCSLTNHCAYTSAWPPLWKQNWTEELCGKCNSVSVSYLHRLLKIFLRSVRKRGSDRCYEKCSGATYHC